MIITFLELADMVDATQEVGGGVGLGWGGVGMITFLTRCTHGRCYATSCFLHLHTWSVLRNIMGWGWGGVRWGGDDNVPRTCTHGRCYATSCFLHLHTRLVLRNIMFLALAHTVGATQHHVSCTCTHGLVSPTDAFKKPLW